MSSLYYLRYIFQIVAPESFIFLIVVESLRNEEKYIFWQIASCLFRNENKIRFPKKCNILSEYFQEGYDFDIFLTSYFGKYQKPNVEINI